MQENRASVSTIQAVYHKTKLNKNRMMTIKLESAV